ncbi:protein YTP1 [Sarocladium implicatum]|nr:protein YTP1 [Sarocladium implicatum]
MHDQTVSDEPLGTIMWIHIFLQMVAYGVIFPIGMVLGIGKSSWHVPTQIFGTALAIVGFFLGHAHTGREFKRSNVHASFAWILQVLLGAQVVFGLYLKGHWGESGINGRVHRLVRPCHSVLGKAMPVFAWAQMVFGGITALGFCQGDYLGQCAAHFIMGSAFVGYGVVLTIILLVGQVWIRRSGRSQEFYDSVILTVWGCINAFTEHHWGTEWVRNDWQHTMIGVIWWCAGAIGIWLSRDRNRRPKRNFIPGAVLFVTGWTMSAHPQELMVSAATHQAFGFALMSAGLARVAEIAFILGDKQTFSVDGRSYNSFQLVPIFSLFAAGFLLMGATAEQMSLIDASSMDHVSYILTLLSVACVAFLFTNILIYIYDHLVNDNTEIDQYYKQHLAEHGLESNEDLELRGLISNQEGEERQKRGSESGSSSTLIGNYERRV